MKWRVLLILQDHLNVNEQPICFVVDYQSNVNEALICFVVEDQSVRRTFNDRAENILAGIEQTSFAGCNSIKIFSLSTGPFMGFSLRHDHRQFF
jgi:hypothetical protein